MKWSISAIDDDDPVNNGLKHSIQTFFCSSQFFFGFPAAADRGYQNGDDQGLHDNEKKLPMDDGIADIDDRKSWVD